MIFLLLSDSLPPRVMKTRINPTLPVTSQLRYEVCTELSWQQTQSCPDVDVTNTNDVVGIKQAPHCSPFLPTLKLPSQPIQLHRWGVVPQKKSQSSSSKHEAERGFFLGRQHKESLKCIDSKLQSKIMHSLQKDVFMTKKRTCSKCLTLLLLFPPFFKFSIK